MSNTKTDTETEKCTNPQREVGRAVANRVKQPVNSLHLEINDKSLNEVIDPFFKGNISLVISILYFSLYLMLYVH